jgi:hypothetical protein
MEGVAMSESYQSNEAERVWRALSEMYGSKVVRDFGESVPNVWRSAVGALNRFEIDRGLRRLTMQGGASPPTLPQFIKACKQTGDDEGTIRPAQDHFLTPPSMDKWREFGNRCLFAYLCTEGAATVESLKVLVAEKNKIAAQYRDIETECAVTDEEFVATCRKSFTKHWQSMTQ